MSVTHTILSDLIAGVSELKKHPMQVIRKAKGKPIAILNRNQPAFYCISPDMFEAILDKLDDEELTQIINERTNEPDIEISIDDL